MQAAFPLGYTHPMKLDRLMAFVEMQQTFQKVDRIIRVPGMPDRWENDVEHSYNLAMLGWYIVTSEKLDLNADLVIKYGMIHDLVEVYAGDTYIYEKDASHLASKHEREAAAAVQLAETFPEFPDLHELIETYEKREDAESRFVYALDKLQPILHIYMDDGATWKEMGITLAMAIENKTPKIAVSPEVQVYYDELMLILHERQEELFGSVTV
ncbi:MAG: metal dependent phosphohydrolase, putative hydrolase of superfamily [Parcubacteria group bacterium]|nr:metal dependent phosphohydrolase, putative hydrolase of superfamily [Parcubacteria group bacterium]